MKSCLADIWSSFFNLVGCYGNKFENLRWPNLKKPISELLLVVEVLDVNLGNHVPRIFCWFQIWPWTGLLQDQMWFFIPIMAYISLVIGCRGFACEDNLWEIMCPKFFVGLRFDLWYLLQGWMWSLIPLLGYISLITGRRGFGCEDESFGGVTFDVIFCMSRFNHVLSRDTLCRDL